jgi:hypothetical protein
MVKMPEEVESLGRYIDAIWNESRKMQNSQRSSVKHQMAHN